MRKKTTEEFIKNAKEVHGDKYDYSLAEYKGNKSNIKIKCNKCGNVFTQRVNNHLFNKRGCPKCNGGVKLTFEDFLQKSKEKHGDRYDYSLVEYKNNTTKVKIICPIHGVFEQRPDVHYLQGCGCQKCANEKNILVSVVDEFPDGTDYRLEYLNLIKKSKQNPPTINFQKHHILPKSMFPLWKERKSNLVKLSYEDHYRAHYLLWKIYKTKEMGLAFELMLVTTNNKYNPDLYKTFLQTKTKNQCKKVFCFEKNKIYNSFKEAASDNGLKSSCRIQMACKDFNKISAGCHWCLPEDIERLREYMNENSKNNGKRYSRL